MMSSLLFRSSVSAGTFGHWQRRTDGLDGLWRLADQAGQGMTALGIAVTLAGLSSILGAVNIIVTIVSMRGPGMRWTRMPMTAWGIFGQRSSPRLAPRPSPLTW